MTIDQQMTIIEQTIKGKALREKLAELGGPVTSSQNKAYVLRQIRKQLEGAEASKPKVKASRVGAQQAFDAVFGAPSRRARRKASTSKVSTPKDDAVEVKPKATKPKAEPKVVATRQRDPRLPGVGETISREFKGVTVKVTVLEDGFEHDDVIYRSLSGAAKAITGYGAVNGIVFFGLGETPLDRKRAA